MEWAIQIRDNLKWQVSGLIAQYELGGTDPACRDTLRTPQSRVIAARWGLWHTLDVFLQ